jgi:hypothetical protein
MKDVVIDADGNPEVLYYSKHRGASDNETGDDEGSSKTRKKMR